MSQGRMKKNEPPGESQPERRIIETEYEEITRVIEFKVFAVQPDGKKARVLGGGSFEEQDLERVAAKIVELANDFAYAEAIEEGYFEEIEEDEGEDV